MLELPPNLDHRPDQDLGSSLTHGVATVLAIVALCFLVDSAILKGTVWHIVSFSIYGISLVTLFLSSTLYHSIRNPRVKPVLRCFDHAAIYLAIAGTYTPVMLTSFRIAYPGWAWSILGVVWGLALLGATLKIFYTGRFRFLSTIVYLFMGWLAVPAVKPLYLTLPRPAFWLLVAGGLAYTAGIFFYISPRLRHNHVIWHLFVMAGSSCHFSSIFFYLLPFP